MSWKAISISASAIAALAGVAFWLATPGQAEAGSEPQSHPPAEFFAGSYSLFGQLPGGGETYSGSVRIEAADDGTLRIERTIDGRAAHETGRFASLEPMFDAEVLNIHDGTGMIVGSCLWSVDLDNYARLTCLRLAPGIRADRPGQEAMFPSY